MKCKIILFLKKIVKKNKNNSLMKKLILAYIIVIGIPIIFFSMNTFYELSNNAKQDAINKYNYELQNDCNNIEKSIYIMRNIINTALNNQELMSYLDSNKAVQTSELINFNDTTYKQLINLQNNNPSIKQINIFTSNSNVEEIWPLIYREDRIIDDDWYKKTLENNGAIYINVNHYDNDIKINSSNNEQSKDLVVSLYKEIVNSDNKYDGIIRVTMPSKDFLPNLFNKESSDNGQIFFYNLNGNELDTDENNLLLKNLKFNRNNFKIFIRDKLKKESGQLVYNQGSENYYILYKETPIANNYLISVIDITNVTKGIKNSRNDLLITSTLLLTVLLIFIYFVTKAILKRIYIVIDSIKKVGNGDLKLNIPVYGTDEAGILAHNFRKMMKTIDKLISENIHKEVIGKETELRALKSQIDGHFLFNTLENIRVMALVEENYIVADSLVSLADMMRYNIKWDNDYVSLKDEINYIKNYVALMTIRYDNQIILNIEIEDQYINKQILKLIIQPLVENAVKHGISEKLISENGTINIYIETDENFLYLVVKDDGKGMDNKKVLDLQDHINGKINMNFGLGLRNVNERIKLYYSEDCGVFVESKQWSYTKLTLKLLK
ncbi:two-component system, sensor histidine kinase YesM [Clostridium acidisoli DSM 12555]|uniref:Two-component system, sensor histidine kinase YesM n=1 Tax=Clostridium acidisoli DSM 12555 TaxID=1121291 RepID=A0A1W1X3P4_9CLOT|nr:sensor histidine kinase [Clostridium acidisoli]SMC18522.1 two-component system, sensor histidine kinase YesM [Clostridium acidisoli DSM 12555]